MRFRCVASLFALVATTFPATRTHSEEVPPAILFLELVAEAFGNQAKVVGFRADDGPTCPESVNLLSVRKDGFSIFTPGTFVEEKPTASISSPDNAREVTFSNGRCAYVVAFRRYETVEGRERQLRLPGPGDPVTPPRITPKLDEVARAFSSRSAAVPNRGSAERRVPERSGFDFVNGQFAGATIAATYSGLIFFGPHSLTLLLADVPSDLSLDTVSDPADPYFVALNIRTPTTRMELSISKEVWDGSWKKVPVR